ncbi:MAG: lipoyl(octanoyl) transferase LipB [Granulosicoccus sp.]
MREFTDLRDDNTEDSLWACEHHSVYTLGQAGKREHILNAADIPVVHSDRGGQVTWHGPGQLVVYTLIDLRRAGYGIRDMVMRLEQSVINVLALQGVHAVARRDAPGVYVDNAKIAALGLRVRRGCSYHGLALNVDANLSAFNGINPCGFKELGVTRTLDVGIKTGKKALLDALLEQLTLCLSEPDRQIRVDNTE